jgi:hypothetical protein
MPLTYQKIARTTVGSGGASTIEFTSIPSTYTDLVVLISARSTGVDPNIMIRFNSSSSNFSQKRLVSDGSSVASYGTYGEWSAWATLSTDTASTFGNSLIYISNYGSSNYKSLSSDATGENNATANNMTLGAELWSNTAAITSVSFVMGSSYNFAQHSSATLYGIKKD